MVQNTDEVKNLVGITFLKKQPKQLTRYNMSKIHVLNANISHTKDAARSCTQCRMHYPLIADSEREEIPAGSLMAI